jgi:hypothetical protein
MCESERCSPQATYGLRSVAVVHERGRMHRTQNEAVHWVHTRGSLCLQRGRDREETIICSITLVTQSQDVCTVPDKGNIAIA